MSAASAGTIKVALADAPTDVLVHLVDNGPANVTELADAIAPAGSVDPRATISYALDLLRRLGYVRTADSAYRWTPTEAGAKAVLDARTQVSP